VILLALLPTHEPVPETTSALDPGQLEPLLVELKGLEVGWGEMQLPPVEAAPAPSIIMWPSHST
jgi:hypothetical protein